MNRLRAINYRELPHTLKVERNASCRVMEFPGLWNTAGYILAGLAAEQHPPDPATDALARYLKNTQMPDGHCGTLMVHIRPPIDSSDIQVTAMAIRGLQVYCAEAAKRGISQQRPISRKLVE
jgi:hypothetical protein